MEELTLGGNSLTCLPAIPSSVKSEKLTLDKTRSSYAACGAGVTVSKSSLKVVPSRTATYTVVLAAAPNGAAGNVTVTPSSSDTAKATVSGPLTFTASNWSTPQTVTVSSVAIGDTTITHTVAGGGYSSTTAASVTVKVSATTLSASTVTRTTATLTIDGHTAPWYYKYTTPTGGSCSSVVASGTSTADLTGLSAATSYTFKAYSDSSCTTELATAESFLTTSGHLMQMAAVNATSIAPTLTATAVEATTATLSIVNYESNWYYQSAVHAGGSCSTIPVEGNTVDLSDLSSGTSYTFAAYSDSTCSSSSLLTTAPAFLTKPGAVSGLTLVATDRSMDVSWIATNGASHYIVQWKPAAHHSYDTVNQQQIISEATITTLNDLDNDVAHTVRVAAVNATGQGEWSTEVTGRPLDSRRFDSLILPEVIKNISSTNMKTITSRLDAAASGSHIPNDLSIDNVANTAISFLENHEEDLNSGHLQWKKALAGRSFLLSYPSLLQQNQSDHATEDHSIDTISTVSSLALWGTADFYSYHNTMEGIDLDGELFSAYLGVDLKPHPHLLTGLAIAMNRSGIDYNADDDSQGTYTINITSANPYISWRASDSISLWFSAAYGRGTVERKQQGKDMLTTDSSDWSSFSAGTRLQLWQSPHADHASSSYRLELKLDGTTAQFMETTAQQARLASSFSRSLSLPSAELISAVELGVRARSNEATGVELAGSIDWRNPRSGFSSSASARALIAGGDQKEWGISGNLNFSPGADGSGFSFVLEPSFGHNSSRIADLWSLNNADFAFDNNLPQAHLKGEMGYGFQSGDGILSPYYDFSFADDGARTIGMGMRYNRSRPNSELDLDFRSAHETSTNNNPDWSIGIHARIGL